ncbi:MAG: hypothetical protein D6678_07190 [Zetaproteobacteria bacterium]|nr:MAG: hypothetical protein D6678_07190 [Zetaproteobacteria bacterium]
MQLKQDAKFLLGRHPAQQLVRHALGGTQGWGWIYRAETESQPRVDELQTNREALWRRLEILRQQRCRPIAVYRVGSDHQQAQRLLSRAGVQLLVVARADTKGRVEIEGHIWHGSRLEPLAIELAEDGALYHNPLHR